MPPRWGFGEGMRMLRSVPALACLVLLSSALPACSLFQNSKLANPRTMQEGSMAHGWQTASFAYSFMNGHTHQWRATLDSVEADIIPLMEAARVSEYDMRLRLEAKAAGDGTEYYMVHLDFVRGGESLTVEGSPQAEIDLAKATVAASEATGLSASQVADGHRAVNLLVNMMTGLNVSNDTMQRHAFALLVLRNKIEAGEKADWFDPNRPPQESVADINTGLSIIAAHRGTVQAWRSEVMTMFALVSSYRTEAAVVELRGQLEDSRAWAEQWEATHSQPTAEDYGVGAAALPKPSDMLGELEEVMGFVAAAAKVAQGIATGSPQATLDGLAKLCPEDLTIKTVLEGAAAATKGDIKGTIAAVSELAGKSEKFQEIEGRLGRVQSALALVSGKSPEDAAKSVGKAAGAAAKRRAKQEAKKRAPSRG